MFVVSGGRGTGKTKALLERVKAEDAIIVCKDPIEMRERAYMYGITGLNIINYEEYYDIVIYSRILNYTEFNNSEMLKNKNEYLDRICKRNDKYKYAIQVINKNNSKTYFENDMLTYTNEEKLCCEEGGFIHKLLLLK